MRKIHLLGIALVAMFAFGAVIASSAFAEEALWLLKEVEVSETSSATIEGNLTLIDLKAPGGEVRVNCSGFFDGTIGPKGTDEITSILNLAGTLINELGGATKIICKKEAGICEESTTDIELQPENLPWHTELELMTAAGVGNGEILDNITSTISGKFPGWNVLCLVLGVNIEDLCEGNLGALLELVGANLIGSFNETELAEEKLEGTCSQGGAESGDLLGEGVVKDTSGTGELDVSSP